MHTNQLKTLFTSDEQGVSPVIGVILMVAVTVILAAVIGAFVMNMGDSLSQSAPQANFEFNSELKVINGTEHYKVTVTHNGGDSFTDANTEKVIAQSSGSDATFQVDRGDPPKQQWVGANGDTSFPLSAGDSAWIAEGADGGEAEAFYEAGETIQIVWHGPSGASQVVAEYTV